MMLSGTQVDKNLLDEHLYKAVASWNAKSVEDYLNKGADPNFIPEYTKESMLHNIASLNIDRLTENLPKLSKTIPKYFPNMTDIPNITIPNKEEVKAAQLRIIELLIKHGANIEAKSHSEVKSYNNNTPLHHASRYGIATVIELLINLGANKEALTDENATPLHLATEYGNLENIKVLISQKANQEAKTRNGSIPLKMSIMYGRLDCSKVLRNSHPNKNSNDYKEAIELEKFLSKSPVYPNTSTNNGTDSDSSYQVNWKPYVLAAGLATIGVCLYLGLSLTTLAISTFYASATMAFLVKLRNYYLGMAFNYYPDVSVISKVSNKGEQEALKIGTQANTWSGYLWSYTKLQAIRHPIAAAAGMKVCLDRKDELTKAIAKLPGMR